MSTDLMALERREQIIEKVNQLGRTNVAELSEHFHVSEATIRRDLAALAQRGLVRRAHGGVMRVGSIANTENPIMQRQSIQIEEKERIGAAAAALVDDGDTLFIAGGSTSLVLARHLAKHRDLTIITDSILIAQELVRQARHRCMILGGMINDDELAVRGAIARQMMEQFHVDKVIIGVRAISIDRGISLETPEETEFFQTAMSSGQQIILVTDSTKFHMTAFMHLAPLDVVQTLVTDTDLESSHAKQIRELGIELILV